MNYTDHDRKILLNQLQNLYDEVSQKHGPCYFKARVLKHLNLILVDIKDKVVYRHLNFFLNENRFVFSKDFISEVLEKDFGCFHFRDKERSTYFWIPYKEIHHLAKISNINKLIVVRSFGFFFM